MRQDVLDRVEAVVAWNRQSSDFEADGSLRDIIVADTTVEDWRTVLDLVIDGHYRGWLARHGVLVPRPTDLEALFLEAAHYLSFSISELVVVGHFFTPGEVELSFDPRGVNEGVLRGLLAFMVELGEATEKVVVMTPENAPNVAIFRFDQEARELRWTTAG
ncbi:hypothetical protein BH11MYX3_BH11MYX3_37010 [soil metagenome]